MPLTAEYALVLDAIVPLARPRVGYAGWDERRWGRTLQIADWHRLSPALFCHLQPRQDAPAAVLSALERVYLANAARSMFMTSALRRVVDALVAADVPALLLKGAALVETVYPDPARREMLDLDILVPPPMLPAASAALTPLGYRPHTDDGQATGATMAMRFSLDEHHGPALIGNEQLVAVELHRHITHRRRGRGSSRSTSCGSARAPPAAVRQLLPSPEDLLLHVCLHFTRNRLGGSYRRRHTGGALAQICDIARIVEYEPIEWASLIDTARGYRLDARVFLGLFAARELGVPIPGCRWPSFSPAASTRSSGGGWWRCACCATGDHLPVRDAAVDVRSQPRGAQRRLERRSDRHDVARARVLPPCARERPARPVGAAGAPGCSCRTSGSTIEIRALEERTERRPMRCSAIACAGRTASSHRRRTARPCCCDSTMVATTRSTRSGR